MGTEKFCLRWNDFETNISVAFRELREEKDFFDVTLACDDSQIQAHKVILSACSPFFRNVLRRNPHQHPLLYLKGVKYKELLSVLNFMYMGEVNVAQEELNSFLAVAEDLRVKGLTQNNSSAASPKPVPKQEAPKQIIRARDPPERDPVPPPKRPRPAAPPVIQQISTPIYQHEEDDIQEVVPVKTEPRDPTPVVQVSQPPPPAIAPPPQIQQQPQAVYHSQPMVQEQEQGTVALDESYAADESYDYGYEGYDDGSGLVDPNTGMPYIDNGADKDLESVINSKMAKVPGTSTVLWQCLECDYTSKKNLNVFEHIEAKHIQHEGYYCQLCNTTCPSKSAFRMHKKRKHNTF